MAEASKHSELKLRTLTNLYNERPAWLRLAHKKLDQAVLAVPIDQAKRILAMCWAIDTLTDVGDLTRAAALA